LFVLGTAVAAAQSKDVRYGTGTWDADRWGNHRVLVEVSDSADAVWVHIPWRRRDPHPENRNLIVVDAADDEEIANVFRVDIQREYGDLIFQPRTAPGTYYIYYLPYNMSGRKNYPTVVYPEPVSRAEPGWLERNSLSGGCTAEMSREDWPQARVGEIQSIDEFNSFVPMEIIAAHKELESLLSAHQGADFLIFPEERRFPIRMTADLPLRWIEMGVPEDFRGVARQGEFYAFQIGVFAKGRAIEDLAVEFTRLENASGAGIPASALRCFNTGGVDWTGRAFTKSVPVDKGAVQALWCGAQIPETAPPGMYEGTVTVRPLSMKPERFRLSLEVKAPMISAAGDDEPWRHSRLRWLDSLIAFDERLVAPFTPVEVEGCEVSCLGRTVTLNDTGFPARIQSRFAPEMTTLSSHAREVLAAPIRLVVSGKDAVFPDWSGNGVRFVRREEGVAGWESESAAGPLRMSCRARMEFDGFVGFKITLTAEEELAVEDIRLEVPLKRDVARYMMGLGRKGGLRPESYQWSWDPKHNQDSVWVGDVNAGLQCAFKDENYSRPLNTNFYLSKPLNMPPSWYNEGRGGCRCEELGSDIFQITASSGARRVLPGEELHFNFELLLTPFKLLDTKGQWGTRYYHSFQPVEEVAARKANTINVHHANEINPFINYPFLRPAEMKAYVDAAHARNMKVKIYYTVRELSNRAPELFALRSLGDEVLSYGPGGGFSWLQEHLGGDYIAAWFVPPLKDAAVINSGVSRWHNYYLEGLNWLVKNVGIDGLYIDDVAFDRTTMKRVRRILDRGRPGALIDLHSANQFNVRDGFANSANLYLEHFPYLNRLWFGEYFDYNASPDFWMVEVSGIPFGLMGEMLQDGGNPWRGMLYGMTSRLPWAGDPSALWDVWDAFGMEDAAMKGYWVPSCPVKTGRGDVLATAYVKPDAVLIALAGWAPEVVECGLRIDWEALGLNPETARLYAPAVRDFQPEAEFSPLDSIPVAPGKGWLLILKKQGAETE